MIARQVTGPGCHTVRRTDTLVSPVGTCATYPRGVDEQLTGAVAPPPDGGATPLPAAVPVGPVEPADPHADTGPVPVVTAEEAAAALAAHHSHVAQHHQHVLHGHPHVAPPVHHEPPRHAETHPRRTALVAGAIAAVLLAVGGVSAYALTRDGDSATPLAGPAGGAQQGIGPGVDGVTPSVSGTSPVGSSPPLAASAPTLVLGDSLGLTVYPWLADLLPDRYVSYEAEVGRSTASTAAALEDMTRIPRVVIVSSGTNDQSASDLRAQATRILDRLGPRRCVVWVDVARPDRVGDPQAEINAAIDRAVAGRSNVRVLRWSGMIAEHPEWLSGDGVHPDQEGAQARAQAFADAALACSPLDPGAPAADQQVLPSSVFLGPLTGQGGSGSSGSSGSTRTPTASSSATKKPKPTTTAAPEPTSAAPSPTATPAATKTADPPPPDPPPVDPPPADPPNPA